MLVDTVSRGGNLLLNVGPKADGTMPGIMEQRLTDIGDWLTSNGEAIYETRPWTRSRQWSAGDIPVDKPGNYKTGYDINKLVVKTSPTSAVIELFFTRKGDSLYVIVPSWPGKNFTVKNLKLPEQAKASYLPQGRDVPWKQEGENVVIDCSSLPTESAFAFTVPFVFKLSKAIPK